MRKWLLSLFTRKRLYDMHYGLLGTIIMAMSLLTWLSQGLAHTEAHLMALGVGLAAWTIHLGRWIERSGGKKKAK